MPRMARVMLPPLALFLGLALLTSPTLQMSGLTRVAPRSERELCVRSCYSTSPACPIFKDVAILVDSSASVGVVGFAKQVEFIQALLRGLPVPMPIRVAVASFSHSVDIGSRLDGDLEGILGKIATMHYKWHYDVGSFWLGPALGSLPDLLAGPDLLMPYGFNDSNDFNDTNETDANCTEKLQSCESRNGVQLDWLGQLDRVLDTPRPVEPFVLVILGGYPDDVAIATDRAAALKADGVTLSFLYVGSPPLPTLYTELASESDFVFHAETFEEIEDRIVDVRRRLIEECPCSRESTAFVVVPDCRSNPCPIEAVGPRRKLWHGMSEDHACEDHFPGHNGTIHLTCSNGDLTAVQTCTRNCGAGAVTTLKLHDGRVHPIRSPSGLTSAATDEIACETVLPGASGSIFLTCYHGALFATGFCLPPLPPARCPPEGPSPGGMVVVGVVITLLPLLALAFFLGWYYDARWWTLAFWREDAPDPSEVTRAVVPPATAPASLGKGSQAEARPKVHHPIDLIFCVDAGGAVGHTNFRKSVNFCCGLFGELEHSNSRSAALPYKDTFTSTASFGRSRNELLRSLQVAFAEEATGEARPTRLAPALAHALQIFQLEAAATERKKALIVICSSDPCDVSEAHLLAARIRNMGVQLVCIGIGAQRLRVFELASLPRTRCVFKLFNHDVLPTILDNLLRSLAETPSARSSSKTVPSGAVSDAADAARARAASGIVNTIGVPQASGISAAGSAQLQTSDTVPATLGTRAVGSAGTALAVPSTRATGNPGIALAVPGTRAAGSAGTALAVPGTRATGNPGTALVVPGARATGSAGTALPVPGTRATGSPGTALSVPGRGAASSAALEIPIATSDKTKNPPAEPVARVVSFSRPVPSSSQSVASSSGQALTDYI